MECPYDESSQTKLALQWYKDRVKSLEESLDIAVYLNLKDFRPTNPNSDTQPTLLSSAKFYGEDTPIAEPKSPEKPGVEYIYESDDTCGSYDIEDYPSVVARVLSDSEESTFWDYDDQCPDLLSDGESDENNCRVDIVDKFARSEFSSDDTWNLGIGYLKGAAPPNVDEAFTSYAETVQKVELYYNKSSARFAKFKNRKELQKPQEPEKPNGGDK